MKQRREKAFWILVALTTLLFIACVVLGIIAIWIPDERWAQTSAVLGVVAFVIGFTAGLIK